MQHNHLVICDDDHHNHQKNLPGNHPTPPLVDSGRFKARLYLFFAGWHCSDHNFFFTGLLGYTTICSLRSALCSGSVPSFAARVKVGRSILRVVTVCPSVVFCR